MLWSVGFIIGAIILVLVGLTSTNDRRTTNWGRAAGDRRHYPPT